MTSFDLADDAILLRLLSESLDQADPVPHQAVRAAQAVAHLSDADAVLARLVADSLLDNEVLLFRHDVTMEQGGQPSDRLLTFATPQLNVVVDLQGDGMTVLGALTPPISVDVDLESARGLVTATSDDLGRFHFEAPPGPCRLRIHVSDEAVVTPWITR